MSSFIMTAPVSRNRFSLSFMSSLIYIIGCIGRVVRMTVMDPGRPGGTPRFMPPPVGPLPAVLPTAIARYHPRIMPHFAHAFPFTPCSPVPRVGPNCGDPRSISTIPAMPSSCSILARHQGTDAFCPETWPELVPSIPLCKAAMPLGKACGSIAGKYSVWSNICGACFVRPGPWALSASIVKNKSWKPFGKCWPPMACAMASTCACPYHGEKKAPPP